MERLYIIDPDNFRGYAENTMKCVPQKDVGQTVVDNSKMTFDEYNQKHGGKLVALSFEEFSDKFFTPYLKGRCKPFTEVTAELYYEMMEVLPPLKMTLRGKDAFFFVGECTTFDLYQCFVRKDGRYYSALRSINTKADKIFDLSDVS